VKEIIGLLAAMTDESNALIRRVSNWTRIKVSSFHGFRFDLAGLTCILVTSGMGVRRAAEAARILAAEHSPCLFISFGIAGAVEADLEIGDVVVANSFCVFEAGPPEPLIPLGYWPPAAMDAITHAIAGRKARLFTGTTITTHGSQPRHDQLGPLTHPVLEMETAGIAQIAARMGFPLLSLRAISDGPRAPIPFDLGEIMDKDTNLRIGRMLKALARHPGALIQAIQAKRNARIAEDHAAIALLAALQFISPASLPVSALLPPTPHLKY